MGTNDRAGVVDDESMMAVARVKQNLWRESWVGAIATVGDPLGAPGAGSSAATSPTRRRASGATRTSSSACGAWRPTARAATTARAYGVKIDYPNDLWDIALTYKRIGRDFDPSLGFVPRPAVQLFNLGIDNRTRIARGPFQQLVHEFRPFVATDLAGRWESYRVFFAPINWRFRSGDRFEVNVNPTGERLVAPFEVSDGVVIAPGRYHWRQYRLEVGTAQKRRLYTQVTWWFGGFYDGTIDQVVWTGAWNPTALLTVEFTGERNMGRLPSATSTRRWSATASGSTSRPTCRSRATCSTTRSRIRSASTPACAGRSGPKPTCSSSTTTTSGRSSTAGSSTRISS